MPLLLGLLLYVQVATPPPTRAQQSESNRRASALSRRAAAARGRANARPPSSRLHGRVADVPGNMETLQQSDTILINST